MTENKLKISFGQLLSSLSYALDVAENRYLGHSKRTAYIAYCIGKEIGLDEDDLVDTYYAALIHDIGMSGQMSQYSVRAIHFDEKLKKAHCQLGYDIIKTLPFDFKIAEYVLYHHEEWGGSGPYKLKGNEIPLPSQIIYIADYFDLFFLKNYKIVSTVDKQSIKLWLDDSNEKMFKTEFKDAFYIVMSREKFWFDLLPTNIVQATNIIEPKKNLYIDIDGLKQISRAFSIFIDSKSRFTYEHSQGISRITKKFATYLGYKPLIIDKLEVAANLHDLGKFVIPNNILEKSGKLTNEEFEIIKSHPYYTKLILKQVEGLEDIAEWAGNHHEKLNGRGYPERLDYRTITKEDQVIALADIYQALTEDRPYRRAMNSRTAIDIMENMANKGYISRKLLLDFKQVVL